MITRSKLSKLTVALSCCTTLFLSGCGDEMPTRDKIVATYPEVADNSVPENNNILCPFVRMMERGGLFEGKSDAATSTIPANTMILTAKEFGCDSGFCGPIANTTAAAQPGPGGVDIEALHTAKGIAHDCGFTFALHGTKVSNTVRQNTLDSLFELADEDGNLTYSDIKTVQLANCEAQGVDVSFIGDSEGKLIFAYLGGVDNGTVAYSDVVKFLHAEMPDTISKKWITTGMVLGIK